MSERLEETYEKQSAFSVCENEAQGHLAELLEKVTTTSELISAVTRATRSTIVSKKPQRTGELASFSTNCIGSLLHLQHNLSPHGIEVTPAIVLHYPWQLPSSCREIHIVGAFADKSDSVILTDPTPNAGYSFGSTMHAKSKGAYITQYDEVLGGTSTYKQLTSAEFTAIRQVYEYEVDPTIPDIHTVLTTLDTLAKVPSYQVRLLHVLLKKFPSAELAAYMQAMPAEAMRKSYLHYLNDDTALTTTAIYAEEAKNTDKMIPKIDHQLAASTSMHGYAYWASVKRQLTGDSPNPLSRLTPYHFATRGSQHPIYDYELFMAGHAPEMGVSNLYTPDWL